MLFRIVFLAVFGIGSTQVDLSIPPPRPILMSQIKADVASDHMLAPHPVTFSTMKKPIVVTKVNVDGISFAGWDGEKLFWYDDDGKTPDYPAMVINEGPPIDGGFDIDSMGWPEYVLLWIWVAMLLTFAAIFIKAL